MKHLLTLFIIFASVTLYSQTLKKTYYDEYGKTMLKESYYVNSAGYGNGAYKKYWKDGNLTLKGTYKNGSKEGVWTSYSRSSGKQQVSQTETFKDNDLNGPAVYYASDKNGRRIMSQGSYLNGEKHGKWSFINPFDSYGYSEEDKKGAKYLKFDKHYDNGVEFFPDGEYKILYSPSGKVQTEGHYFNGEKSGDWVWYNPDGTIKAEQHYATPEEIKIMEENAKIEEEKAKVKRQIEKEKRDKSIIIANKTLDSNKVEKAIKLYQEVGVDTKYLGLFLVLKKKYENGEIDLGTTSKTYDAYGEEVYNTSMGSQLIKQLKNPYLNQNTLKAHKDYCFRYIEIKGLEILEIEKINKEVQAAFDSYINENVKQVKTTQRDPTTGEIIMNTTYLKNKVIYTKSIIVLDAYIEEFNAATSVALKQELGKKVIDSINTLNQIPESDWKDLKKQLKKVEDPEQTKSILKL